MAPIGERIAQLSRRIPLLAAATPVNAREERARLLAAARGRRRVAPSWTYAPLDTGLVRAELERLADRLDHGRTEELARCTPRGRGLALGRSSARRRGVPFALARQRFASFGAAWVRRPTASPPWCRARRSATSDGAAMATDSPHPASPSRMRDAVRDAGVPFAVEIEPRLFALAATGRRVVLIAPGRTISDEAARRTVLHELHGHVMPRVRAERAHDALFDVGTARGVDEQEGYALVLEDRHGFLSAARRREIGARYAAVRAMRDGACFEEVYTSLRRDHGLALSALQLAERLPRERRAARGTRPRRLPGVLPPRPLIWVARRRTRPRWRPASWRSTPSRRSARRAGR